MLLLALVLASATFYVVIVYAPLGQFLCPVFLGPVWKTSSEAVFYVGAAVAIASGLLILQGKTPQNQYL